MNRKTIDAIIRTLAASVDSGLNASLTPEDCKVILRLLLNSSRKRQPKPDIVMGKMKTVLRNFAEGVIDDLMEQGPFDGPPTGRKRK